MKVDLQGNQHTQELSRRTNYQGKEEEIEEVINDAEEHISDTEGFDEILYWQEVKRRIQTYLELYGRNGRAGTRGGYEIKDMRLQTYGLSFLKNVDLMLMESMSLFWHI